MKLYQTKDDGLFQRTKADAEKTRRPFDLVEIETDQKSLIERLNGYVRAIADAKTQAQGGPSAADEAAAALGFADAIEAIARLSELTGADATDADEPAEPAPRPSRAAVPRDDSMTLEERIMELDGQALINVVAASVERLSMSAGAAGWEAYAKQTMRWKGGGRAPYHGLGMLFAASLVARSEAEA